MFTLTPTRQTTSSGARSFVARSHHGADIALLALVIAAALPVQAGPRVPAAEFRFTQLAVVQSAEAGHWVHSARSQPANPAFPPTQEQGCMSKAQLGSKLGDNGGSVCDMEIKQNDSSRASLAMHCKVTPQSPATVLPLEIVRQSDQQYQVTVGLGGGSTIVHSYRRTGACKAG